MAHKFPGNLQYSCTTGLNSSHFAVNTLCALILKNWLIPDIYGSNLSTPFIYSTFSDILNFPIVYLQYQTRSITGNLLLFSRFSSASKSSTRSLVSSVPLRLPTAQTSLVLLHRTRHTTPPLPPLSSVTRLRRNSPDFKSQILTVPSSDDVMTNFLLNCKQVTALWCLFEPAKEK